MRAPVLFAVLSSFALALAWLAHRHDRFPGDLWLMRRVQDLPGALEGPAEAIRAVTSTETVLILGIVPVVVLLVRRAWWLALQAAVTLALLPFIQGGVKDMVDRPRPDPALVDLRDTFTSSSFPSGHVMSGTVLLALVALAAWVTVPRELVRKLIVAACIVLAMLNGLANVYMGVHWPSDVLGGYLWAGVVLVGVWAAAVSRLRRIGL